MSTPITIYRDDADAALSWQITDSNGLDIDWADPQIAIGDAAYTAAAWEGDAASTRTITLAAPLALGLAANIYAAYLKVPNGNDIYLGRVNVADRT
jgi:hypothetical protein